MRLASSICCSVLDLKWASNFGWAVTSRICRRFEYSSFSLRKRSISVSRSACSWDWASGSVGFLAASWDCFLRASISERSSASRLSRTSRKCFQSAALRGHLSGDSSVESAGFTSAGSLFALSSALAAGSAAGLSSALVAGCSAVLAAGASGAGCFAGSLGTPASLGSSPFGPALPSSGCCGLRVIGGRIWRIGERWRFSHDLRHETIKRGSFSGWCGFRHRLFLVL